LLLFSTDPHRQPLRLLSLHDALPISQIHDGLRIGGYIGVWCFLAGKFPEPVGHGAFARPSGDGVIAGKHPLDVAIEDGRTLAVADRKSTRLNSSHVSISYAVFCLENK